MAERVLVIGACGFIGRAVLGSFQSRGVGVIGFDLAAHRGSPPAGIEFIDGSVTDRAVLSQAVERSKPDAIVSLAAFSLPSTGLAISAEADLDAAFAVNVDGIRNVIETSLEHRVPRIIWSSSTVTLGPAAVDSGAVLDETAVTRPVNLYGLTKAIAEQISVYARDVIGLDIAAVRPTLVMGPHHPYAGALDPIKRLFARHPGDGPVDIAWGSHTFDIVHVDDVAAAIVALCQRPEPLSPIYHVNGGPTTIGEIVDTVKALRPSLEIRLSNLEPDIVYPLVSAGRIAAETGFVPRFHPRDIIADCIQQSAVQPESSKGGINA